MKSALDPFYEHMFQMSNQGFRALPVHFARLSKIEDIRGGGFFIIDAVRANSWQKLEEFEALPLVEGFKRGVVFGFSQA